MQPGGGTESLKSEIDKKVLFQVPIIDLKDEFTAPFFCKKGGEIFPAQKTAVKAHNPAPVTDLFHLITGTVNCKKGK